MLINDGSVGKPKYGKPNATYCILDIDKQGKVTASIKEVEYEYRKIVKDTEVLNFPSALVRSYETGLE